MIIADKKGRMKLSSTHYRSSRSRGLAVFAAVWLMLVILLAACGNQNDASTQQSPSAAPAEATSAPSASPEPAFKTISTINGDLEIPVHPERIVAEEYLGTLIALDVIPVGAPGLSLENYYFKDALQGIESSGTYGQPSAEKILELQPDFIITGNNDSYEVLSKIAPTLVVPYGELKNVHDELTYFGEVLGKEAEAKAWLEEFERSNAEQKARVDAVIPADATFSILEYSDKSVWAYGDNFGRGGQPVFQVLGRKPPEEIAASLMEKQWAEISAEMLAQYAGDYLIVTSNNRTVEDFEKDPIWGVLPAVKNKQLYVWPEARSWYYDPLAVLEQTKELADWLVGLQAGR
jgi:iron complex transport system substrate-binding protein